MLLMPHSYVDSVTLTNNQLTLQVEVSDFRASGGYVEVSGQASQVGGALAVIYQTVNVPQAPAPAPAPAANGNGNGTGNEAQEYFVEVTAAPVAGSVAFQAGQDISVFVRVARVWLTVLGNDPAAAPVDNVAAPSPGVTWDLLRAVTEYGQPLDDDSKQPATAGQS
jgi:hypothetical protein